MGKVRNIGIPGIEPPEKECNDRNCPFHGDLPVRGRIFEGVVTSTRMYKTITFQRDYLTLVKKYGR
ncbi:MAG: 30S ribosomal protein S17, partial [Candidatus Thorarchaeota archaeon]